MQDVLSFALVAKGAARDCPRDRTALWSGGLRTVTCRRCPIRKRADSAGLPGRRDRRRTYCVCNPTLSGKCGTAEQDSSANPGGVAGTCQGEPRLPDTRRSPHPGDSADRGLVTRTTAPHDVVPSHSHSSAVRRGDRHPMSPFARVLRSGVRGYQRVVTGRPSPCRHIPSCSNYALEALEGHGAIRGGWFTTKRLCRCHPWGTHGYDPVPPSEESTCSM